MIRTVSITETRQHLKEARKDEKKIIHGKLVGVVALTLFCDYFLLTLVIPSKSDNEMCSSHWGFSHSMLFDEINTVIAHNPICMYAC